MRRFFLALWVRVEVVAWPLPNEVEPAQRPPHGIVGYPLLGEEVQGLLEQWDRPTHPGVAEVLGRESEESLQQVFLVLVQ
jgi:hypothetical protein